MNILYLIGNGFDLAQGLKTSYLDFYNYLKSLKPINSVSELMMEHIKGPDVELWKDMELKLDFQGYWRHINRSGLPAVTGVYVVYRCTY